MGLQIYNMQPTGHQSFLFQTINLDLTMECLRKKGVPLAEGIRYDWGISVEDV